MFGVMSIKQVFPPVNPTVLEQLRSVDCIVYAMGSLFTSICPSLVSTRNKYVVQKWWITKFVITVIDKSFCSSGFAWCWGDYLFQVMS